MKSCANCVNFGYIKENGQVVCRYGKNFDFKRNAYNPEYAERCGEYAVECGGLVIYPAIDWPLLIRGAGGD